VSWQTDRSKSADRSGLCRTLLTIRQGLAGTEAFSNTTVVSHILRTAPKSFAITVGVLKTNFRRSKLWTLSLHPNRGRDLARTKECPSRFEVRTSASPAPPENRSQQRLVAVASGEDAVVTEIRSLTKRLAIHGYDAFIAHEKGTRKGTAG
jgi:hypothetical protein